MLMPLVELLRAYTPWDAPEAAMTARLLAFLGDTPEGLNAFGRELAGIGTERGHVTGSAWIVNAASRNAAGSRTVLVHHAKLGRWVQPGGHCDGDPDVPAVAMREAREETGLEVALLQSGIFDVDVHLIPEYWNTPAHWHFDVRFLLQADDEAAPCASAESRAVRWMPLEEAAALNPDASIVRMIGKTRRRFSLAK